MLFSFHSLRVSVRSYRRIYSNLFGMHASNEDFYLIQCMNVWSGDAICRKILFTGISETCYDIMVSFCKLRYFYSDDVSWESWWCLVVVIVIFVFFFFAFFVFYYFIINNTFLISWGRLISVFIQPFYQFSFQLQFLMVIAFVGWTAVFSYRQTALQTTNTDESMWNGKMPFEMCCGMSTMVIFMFYQKISVIWDNLSHQ